MSSLLVSRNASAPSYAPGLKPSPAIPSLKRSSSTPSSNNPSPASLQSGPTNPQDASSSSFSHTNEKKRKKQRLKDVLETDGIQKESASHTSESTLDSKGSKNGSEKTITPASSDSNEQQEISDSKEPIVKSLVKPNSTHHLFNVNKPSIAALLEEPVRYHSTKANLNVVKYTPINDPDYVSEFDSGPKKGKGKEREVEDDEGGSDQDQDEDEVGSSHGSNTMKEPLRSISNPSKSVATASSPNPNTSSQNSSPSKTKPERSLYIHPISFQFPSTQRRIGRGLNNSGNTCYLNSTLQALIHTPPLLSSLLTRKSGDFTNIYNLSSKAQKTNRFHALDALQAVARKAMQGNGGGSYWPKEISGNLKQFAKPLRKGRQEDAHEFLRFLLEAMQQQCLGYTIKYAAESPLPSTTLPYKIFGGKLRSRVHCLNCKANSDTYETFLDLSLDINGKIHSLDDALKGFTRVDTLEGSERYKCETCKKKVNARKQFTIDSLPPILTIHLKRFTLTGGKMNKLIDFKENLNLTECLSAEKRSSEPVPQYKLYAVVHHLGSSPNSGHYIATVKDFDGRWKTMDDSFVSSSSSPVGDKSAYILFYQRLSPSKLQQLTSGSSNSQTNPFARNSFSSNPPISNSSANASGSRFPGSQINGIPDQNKKRKLLDEEEDIGQAESRVDRSSQSNAQISGSKPISRIIHTPKREDQLSFKRSNAMNVTPSVSANSFYSGSKKAVKNPLDSIEDHSSSSRFPEEGEAGEGYNDEDDEYQALYASNQSFNPNQLSRNQKKKLKKERKRKSSAHGTELGHAKGFNLGPKFTPGLDTLSGDRFGNGSKFGGGNWKANGNGGGNKKGKKHGRDRFDQGGSFANRMKSRH